MASGVKASKMESNHDMEYIKPKGWGYRHQQSFLLLIGLGTSYVMRSCMGVAIVDMTDNDRHFEDTSLVNINLSKLEQNISKKVEDHLNGNTVTDSSSTYGFQDAWMFSPPYPLFNWSKKEQDLVLSSFFWGYIVLQIPAGILTHKFGTRLVLCTAIFINSIICIIFPWIAFYGGWISVMACRMLQGLSQSCLYPGIHTSLGKWAPLQERGCLSAIVYGGSSLGIFITLPLSGLIASSVLGWPGIFRCYGLFAGIVAVILWYFLADSPSQHPKISSIEQNYLERELGRFDSDAKPLKIPWCSILKSPAVWAIIMSHVSQTLMQVFMYTEIPSFINKVMKVNIKMNGLMSAVPFMTMWFGTFFFSWLTDLVIRKNILSVTKTRKLADSLGNLPISMGYIALGYVTDNIYVTETLLILLGLFKSASISSFKVNMVDLFPNFSGGMGLSNFVANVFGSLAPIVSSTIVGSDDTNVVLWRRVFFLSASIVIVANIVYLALGTCERASWNQPEKKEDEGIPMILLKE